MGNEQLIGPRAALAASVRSLIDTVVGRRTTPDRLAQVASQITELDLVLQDGSTRSTDSITLNDSGFGRASSPASGAGNPLAPEIEFRKAGNGIIATVTLGVAYEGPPDTAHGGVVALIFHEVLGETSRLSGSLGVSAYLDVQYRRPVPLHVPLRIQATVVSAERWKTTITGSLSTDGANSVHLATATAMFVFPRH